MPTVLRRDGFRVIIFHPPREHQPPHVHVRNAVGEVVIELETLDRSQHVRDVTGMRDHEVAQAFWLVEENSELLLARLKEIHG